MECERCAMLQQQVADRDRFLAVDRATIERLQARVAELEHLLARTGAGGGRRETA
jgi:hypothetical protein